MKECRHPYNPLILPCHRLLEAFSKSDDERDFYLDRIEGFLVYVCLDKSEEDLNLAYDEIERHPERYCLIPKLTYYETKKIMENFVHEKIYDVDIKERLLNIISSKEAKESFLEFIYDNITELDKWQQYYKERSRIRIIEFMKERKIAFVFEEDLDLPDLLIGKIKETTCEPKVSKDVAQGRSLLETKAKSYYSNEAVNPRPKRGRPPKQQSKVVKEPTLTDDVYVTVPPALRPFLFIPQYKGKISTFSSKFDSEDQVFANLKGANKSKIDPKLEILSQRMESLRYLSGKLSFKDEPSDKRFTVKKDTPEKSSNLSVLLGDITSKKSRKERNKRVKKVVAIKQKKGK